MSAKEGKAKVTIEKCPYCNKEHEFPTPGNGVGNGVTLGNRLDIKRDKHPWQLKNSSKLTGDLKTKFFKKNSIQAHHLVASSVVKNNKSDGHTWKTMCAKFGYDINKRENGVWLPSVMALACQLGVPLHRGGHPPSYYHFVRNKLQKLMDKGASGGYCPSNYEKFISIIDTQCKRIFLHITKFRAVLTSDAYDYLPTGNGCGGSSSISSKSSSTCNRLHGIPVGSHNLAIGT